VIFRRGLQERVSKLFVPSTKTVEAASPCRIERSRPISGAERMQRRRSVIPRLSPNVVELMRHLGSRMLVVQSGRIDRPVVTGIGACGRRKRRTGGGHRRGALRGRR